MKSSLILLSTLLLAACSTSIANLTLPSPSTIKGTVSDVEDGEFTLTDATGEVEVEWEGNPITPALREGEVIMVSGIVDEDDTIEEGELTVEEFDAFCIKREDGTVITALPNCPLR